MLLHPSGLLDNYRGVALYFCHGNGSHLGVQVPIGLIDLGLQHGCPIAQFTVQWYDYGLSYSFPWRQSHEGLSDYKDEEQEEELYVMDTE